MEANLENRDQRQLIDEADLFNRRVNFVNTYKRLEYDKAYLLHRALHLGQEKLDEADAWKRSGESDRPGWTSEQQAQLQLKYFECLMAL